MYKLLSQIEALLFISICELLVMSKLCPNAYENVSLSYSIISRCCSRGFIAWILTRYISLSNTVYLDSGEIRVLRFFFSTLIACVYAHSLILYRSCAQMYFSQKYLHLSPLNVSLRVEIWPVSYLVQPLVHILYKI